MPYTHTRCAYCGKLWALHDWEDNTLKYPRTPTTNAVEEWTPDQPLHAEATSNDFDRRWWARFPSGGSEAEAWALAREFAAACVTAKEREMTAQENTYKRDAERWRFFRDHENASIEALYAKERATPQTEQIVECEACGFRYGAEHTMEDGTGYKCPLCEAAAAREEVSRLREHLTEVGYLAYCIECAAKLVSAAALGASRFPR